MGFINRKIEPDPQLIETGIHCRALILEMRLLNRGSFKMSEAAVQNALDGSSSPIRVKLRLAVTLPSGETYHTKTNQQVPMLKFTRLGPGGSVPVVVDPANHKRIAIDWDGQIDEPTLEQRAANDPVLRSVLDRRQR